MGETSTLGIRDGQCGGLGEFGQFHGFGGLGGQLTQDPPQSKLGWVGSWIVLENMDIVRDGS